MEGVPADIGSWSVVRIFHEGSRVLSSYFNVFLPAVLLCIFPAALIKVLYMQFLFALRVQLGVQLLHEIHSKDTELKSFWMRPWAMFPFSMVDQAPQFFILGGSIMLFRNLTNVVYNHCRARSCHKENFVDSVRLVLFRKDVEKENAVLQTTATEQSLYERVRKTSKGKKLKACAVVVVCWMISVFVFFSSGGLLFTPQAVAEMGLPPATIYLFTVLVTLMSTATTYLILVNLVLFIWICSPTMLIPK